MKKVLSNPLGEVFGYPVGNMSNDAANHRSGRLCPYNNPSGPNCTKNSVIDPLGVCSIVEGNGLAITCPVRFRESNLIVSDAAQFFFPESRRPPIALTEVRLNDKRGKSAGNIDIAIVMLDDTGAVADFGALEVQAVYVSGNVGKAFKEYMTDPAGNSRMQWPSKNYPRPDYLSSSRKRLAPQLIYKGGILNTWKKKIAVAVHHAFFEQLPALPVVEPNEADIAWLVYDLQFSEALQRYRLERIASIYTKFKPSLDEITNPDPGNIGDFIRYLDDRIKKHRLNE
jgi:Restriction endonuclease NotI